MMIWVALVEELVKVRKHQNFHPDTLCFFLSKEE